MFKLKRKLLWMWNNSEQMTLKGKWNTDSIINICFMTWGWMDPVLLSLCSLVSAGLCNIWIKIMPRRGQRRWQCQKHPLHYCLESWHIRDKHHLQSTACESGQTKKRLRVALGQEFNKDHKVKAFSRWCEMTYNRRRGTVVWKSI